MRYAVNVQASVNGPLKVDRLILFTDEEQRDRFRIAAADRGWTVVPGMYPERTCEDAIGFMEATIKNHVRL